MGTLRFLLAFAVVLAHSAPIFGFSGIGANAVPAFFIISGFYMNMVLSTRYLKLDNGIKKFYFNRFIRLYPTYWATLLIIVVLGGLPQTGRFPFFDGIVYLSRSIDKQVFDSSVASLWASIPNLFMVGSDILRLFAASKATGEILPVTAAMYGSGTYGELYTDMYYYLVIPPIWSLGVELVCYAFSPWLAKRGIKALIAAFIFLACIRVVWNLLADHLAWAHLPSWFNAGYFLLGMLSFRVSNTVNRLQGESRAALATIPFIIWAFYPQILAVVENEWVIWGVYAVAIPALFGVSKHVFFDNWIGELSYPIYITHMIFASSAATYGRFQGLVALLASVLLSWLLIRYVDIPVRQFKKRE